MMALQDVMAGLVALLALWLIVNPYVPTGVLCTGALGVVFCGALWSMDDGADQREVVRMLLLALLVGLLAVVVRTRRTPGVPKRRLSDWCTVPPDLSPETQPCTYELSDDEQRQVAGGKGAP
jgi:hypothetical protein